MDYQAGLNEETQKFVKYDILYLQWGYKMIM